MQDSYEWDSLQLVSLVYWMSKTRQKVLFNTFFWISWFKTMPTICWIVNYHIRAFKENNSWRNDWWRMSLNWKTLKAGWLNGQIDFWSDVSPILHICHLVWSGLIMIKYIFIHLNILRKLMVRFTTQCIIDLKYFRLDLC